MTLMFFLLKALQIFVCFVLFLFLQSSKNKGVQFELTKILRMVSPTITQFCGKEDYDLPFHKRYMIFQIKALANYETHSL